MAEIRFGTDGWRAVMCGTFTMSNVGIVVQAIAEYIKEGKESQKGLVVGYDCRFFAEDFAAVCSHIIAENKIRVYLAKNAIPTPLAAFSVKSYETDGAIMFTASHNPAKYNGIKFIPEYAGPATPGITKEIEKNIKYVQTNPPRDIKKIDERFDEIPSWLEKIESNPLLNLIDPLPEYITHLRKIINLELFQKKPLRLVIDPMYGAGKGILNKIFEELGQEVFAIHNFRDPLFGGSLPDPSPENLQELRSEVLKNQADLGLALDGDGDRFGVVDSQGKYLSSNQVLAILADYLLRIRGLKGLVVRSVATTHLLDIIAKKNGASSHETLVGFKYIGEIMRKQSVVIGGEESGGLSILGHIPEKDGILACLLVAEVVSYYQKPLSQIMEELYKRYGRYISKRLDIKCPEKIIERILNHLQSESFLNIAGMSIQKKVRKGGVKLLLEDGSWLLARPSGTEPLVRVYIESTSKEGLQTLEKYVKELF